MQFETIINEESFDVSFNDDFSLATVNGKSIETSWTIQKNGRRLLRIGTRLYKIDDIQKEDGHVSFTINGRWVRVKVKDEQELLLERLGFKTNETAAAGKIDAPMPGKILEILVSKEHNVQRGQPVIILEAMKMENEIKAPAPGTVSEIYVQAGDSVEKNQPLIEIIPSG